MLGIIERFIGITRIASCRMLPTAFDKTFHSRSIRDLRQIRWPRIRDMVRFARPPAERGTSAAGGGQPDLYHGIGAGADADDCTGDLYDFSAIQYLPCIAGSLFHSKPDAEIDRQHDPRLPQPVREQGDAPVGRRRRRADRDGGGDAGDDRSRLQSYLAGQTRRAIHAAGAGVLGDRHARTAADRHIDDDDVVCCLPRPMALS